MEKQDYERYGAAGLSTEFLQFLLETMPNWIDSTIQDAIQWELAKRGVKPRSRPECQN